MKRCPQCLFLYPDTDERCDFDQTPLEVVDDSALEAATNPKRKRRPVLPIAAAVVLVLGLLAFGVYYGLSNRVRQTSAAPENSNNVVPVVQSQPIETVASPTPVPSPSAAPSPSPSPSPKIAPATVSTSHTRATLDPVSTSGPGIAQRQGGKPVIMLTSGSKIEADEVWRTRDGVWYRRNGLVTLLKRNQVKSIITR
jgi:cytoskeletal protein RodZ